MATTVNISELRKALDLLLNQIADDCGEIVVLDHDMYWHIDEEVAYNPYEKPVDFSLGDLEDDWNYIRRIANKQDDPIGYALVWASSILRAVGEEVP